MRAREAVRRKGATESRVQSNGTLAAVVVMWLVVAGLPEVGVYVVNRGLKEHDHRPTEQWGCLDQLVRGLICEETGVWLFRAARSTYSRVLGFTAIYV